MGLLNTVQAQSNYNFTISGKIKNSDSKINLVEPIIRKGKIEHKNNIITVDSNGKFSFIVKTVTQNPYILQLRRYDNPFFLMLINDAPNIIIEGDVLDKKSFSIKNSIVSNNILEMERFLEDQKVLFKEYAHKSDSIDNLETNNNHTIINDYHLKIDVLRIYTKKKLLDYYNTSTNFFIDWAVLGNIYYILNRSFEEGGIINIDKKELQQLINQSIKKYPHNNYLKLLKADIDNKLKH